MTTWVIKIGTSLLRGNDKYTTFDIINNYCSYISKAQKNGDKFILVSSGAVGLGCHKMSFKTRPKEIISLQASAAIGQLHLMNKEFCLLSYLTFFYLVCHQSM